MGNYKYVLSADELRESVKGNTTATEPVTLETFYTDKPLEKEKVEKVRFEDGKKVKESSLEWTGLATLQKDTGRTVKINDKSISKVDEEKFSSIILKELGIDPALLDTSYSQNLTSLLSQPLLRSTEVGIGKGLLYDPKDREDNLYKQDGEVYFKTKVQSYSFQQTGHDKAYVIPGPVEILYKLENGMFKLQQMQTESDFVYNAFIGNKDVLKDQLTRIINPPRALSEIENILSRHESSSKPEIQDVFKSALAVVRLSKKNAMSTNELVAALEALKPALANAQQKQSFIRRHSIIGNDPASSLREAIKKAKALPDYKPEEALSARKSSTSASNDASRESRGSEVKIHMKR